MDTVALVEEQIEAGQELLDRLGAEGFAFRAACWVKPVDEDRWSLYIVTPGVDELGSLGAYKQVLAILRSLGDVEISSSNLKLIGEKHPVARDLLAILQRFPERVPASFRPSSLGGIAIEDVHIYPLAKKSLVEVTIYGLVFQGEPGGCLHLSLEPHNPHTTLRVEDRGVIREFPAVTGIEGVVAAPEGATPERDKWGQMVLAWDLRGKRTQSSANEVWTFAKLGMHGFRFLQGPNSFERASAPQAGTENA
jgi:hypothetical protein